MPERLTEAEVAAIRERWEATERRIVQREGHEDIPRLLATLEAERARAAALVEAAQEAFAALDDGCAFCARISHDISCGVEYSRMAAARDAIDAALTRGGDDGD